MKRAGTVSYTHLIRGLSRVAATECGKDNINVNIVAPLAMTHRNGLDVLLVGLSLIHIF